MATLDIQSKLVVALKTIIAANTYINANGVTVKESYDQSVDRGQKAAIINVDPARKLQPNYQLYESQCEIVAASYIDDDKNGGIAKMIHKNVAGEVAALTPAILNAQLSGLQVDGVVAMDESGEQGEGDDYRGKTIKFKIYSHQTA